MSAPQVLGRDVAAVQAWVQRETRSRGFRGPLSVVLSGISVEERSKILLAQWAHITPALWSSAKMRAEYAKLAHLSLALKSLENYYSAIGSTWDSRRFYDMRIGVDIALDRFRIEEERDARCRHADMWQSAFARV